MTTTAGSAAPTTADQPLPVGTLRLEGPNTRSDIQNSLGFAIGEDAWAFKVTKISPHDRTVPKEYRQAVASDPLAMWRRTFHSEPFIGTMNGLQWAYRWKLDHFVRPASLSEDTHFIEDKESKVFASVLNEYPLLKDRLLFNNTSTALFDNDTVDVPRAPDQPIWKLVTPGVIFRQGMGDDQRSRGATLTSQITLELCNLQDHATPGPEGDSDEEDDDEDE